MVATSAKVRSSQDLPDLFHGEEIRVWGDSAYARQKQTIKGYATRAKDFTQAKGGRISKLSDEARVRNRNKSRERAQVERQFNIIKWQFGYSKVRYHGRYKNAHRLFVACAFRNLMMAKKSLPKRRPIELQVSYV